ncbi:MAG: HlyD family efflux transporter periplasmic adaptor subunit [Tepidisphaeraceae bacterium]
MSTNIVQSRDPERERRQQQQAEQEQMLMRNRLVQKLLQPTPDLREYLKDLVYTQAVVIAGTEAAAFLLHVNDKNEGSLENVAHIRPDGSNEETRKKALQAFSDIIAQCINQGHDGIIQVSDDMDLTVEPQFCLVTLLRAEGRVVAATGVITRCRDNARAQQRLDVMQVVAGYFDYYMLRRNAEALKAMTQNHQDVLQYATAFGTAEGFVNGVNNLCNEIATRTGSTRVSVGWVQGWSAEHPKVKLKGLSHTEQFDKKQELSVQLVKVMEECVDQQEIVQFDPHDDIANTANVTREAQALSRLEGGNRVLTLPLRRKGEIVGVMTLEFPNTKKATDQEATSLAVAAEMLGPVLYDRFDNDRWITTKIGVSAMDGWKALVGPKYWLAKGILFLSVCTLAFLVLFKPMHRLKGGFTFEVMPAAKRMISANVNAKLYSVNVEPGSVVTKGQVLAKFDSQSVDAQLAEAQAKLRKAIVELKSIENTVDERTGRPRTAEARSKAAEAEALQAEVDRLTYEQAQYEIVAPFDGKVLNGDLKDKLGKQMQVGESMFELADTKPENLRVEITLPERDVQGVTENLSRGEVKTTARPDLSIPITVTRVVPQGVAKEGKNFFKVYATVDAKAPGVAEQMASWTPGSGGEAAIDDKPRSLLWQWTRPLIDWVRLRLWI